MASRAANQLEGVEEHDFMDFYVPQGRMKLVAKGLETRIKKLGGLIRSRKATRQDRGHVKRRHTPKDGTCREMAPAIRNQFYTSGLHTQGVPAFACMGFSKQGRHSKCQVTANTPRQETGLAGLQSLCLRIERHPQGWRQTTLPGTLAADGGELPQYHVRSLGPMAYAPDYETWQIGAACADGEEEYVATAVLPSADSYVARYGQRCRQMSTEVSLNADSCIAQHGQQCR